MRININAIHNQCLALQAVAILIQNANSYRAAWIYERAGRRILPELWEGMPERPTPWEYLPKVMVEDAEFYERQTLPGDAS